MKEETTKICINSIKVHNKKGKLEKIIEPQIKNVKEFGKI